MTPHPYDQGLTCGRMGFHDPLNPYRRVTPEHWEFKSGYDFGLWLRKKESKHGTQTSN
jgi:hypothetical protein